MKKTLITISLLSTFTYAVQYNAVIGKEHNKYTDIIYLPTGEITCSTLSPLENEIYKDTNFTQLQSDCTEIYRSADSQEKQVPVEDRTEDILGTLVLSDCKNILNQGHSRGNGIYTINAGGTNFDTQCEMTIDNGGWTLIASKADDGQHYWTWNNLSYLYNGGKTGDPSILNQDYQNEGWANVIADEVLLSDSSLSKHMIYSTIISNEPLKNEFSSSLTTSPEYSPRIKSSGWWVSPPCDPSGIGLMRTSVPDTDANAWDQGAKGFVWRAKNNNNCNYDDTSGGLLNSNSSLRPSEVWTYDQFYHRNFDNDALTIWVR